MLLPPAHVHAPSRLPYPARIEAAFTNDAGDAQQVYADDRRTTGTALYTLRPERLVLSDLVGTDGQPAGTSFTGPLFCGDFERGGTELLDPVTVEVRHVVHFRRFDHHAVRPTDLTYLAVGKGDERLLAHLVTMPPDFEHVVAMRQVPGASRATDEVLRKGSALAIAARPDGPDDTCERATRSRRASSATGRSEAIYGSSRGGSCPSRKGSWQQVSTHTEIRRLRRHGSSSTQRNSGSVDMSAPVGRCAHQGEGGFLQSDHLARRVLAFTARGRHRACAGAEIC
ncbi:hypothetical protein ACFYNL_05995 [Streptomyces sp. NPDC007808]|uniref:hypothetical protein n=1 Tax=Streptomyces sp. NPDC007808 TaxID=3364779 RepID=UPI0036BFC454